MPTRSRSVLKRQRQESKRRARSKALKTRLKTMVKKARAAVMDKKETSPAAIRQAVSDLDKAASKGVIHRNTASRRKSRLQKFAAKYGS